VIAAAEYDSFRDGLKKNLESLSDPQGKALEAKGFRPEELYREVRGSAPDLVVEFGALAWRSVASVGHAAIYLQDQVLSQAETANLQDKVEDKEQDRVHDEPGENLRAEGSSRDLCNPARHGMFILAAPNCPLSGEYHGAHLLDIAPTLLELGGYQIPEGMQGRSLVAGIESSRGTQAGNGSDAKPEAEKTEAEKTVLDRLRGLGYV
jgi:predicted AlkP superfamily phosphohydrolase/phosphomutase